MRGFTGSEKVVVDVYWKDGEGIVLTVPNASSLAHRVRHLLFAWHEPSWYGAEIEERIEERSLVKELPMSPLLALDYLAAPEPVRLVKVEWSERALPLMELAKLLREALLNGWYMPDWSGWSEDTRAWKLAVPDTEPDATARLDELAPRLEAQGDKGAVRRWLSQAVEELIGNDSTIAASWAKTVADAGIGAMMMKAADEEDWLVSIGLRKDHSPFRAALQLLEPDDEAGWRLRPAIQDRAEGGSWVTLERSAEAAWDWHADGASFGMQTGDAEAFAGESVTASARKPMPLRWQLPAEAPEEWRSYFAERMSKEEAKWLAALPDWVESESESEAGFDFERAGDGIKTELSDGEAWAFLEDASVRLLASGCSVLLPGWWEAVRSRKMRLKAKVKSSVGSSEQPMFGLNQIVDFDWKLAVGNVDMTEAEFMRLAEENRRLMRVGGQWVHLDPDDVDRIRKWLKKGGKRDFTMRDVLEMHLRGGSELETEREDMEALEAEVELNEHLAAWIAKLNESADLPLVAKPESFQGELRPYQLQGVSWLAFLRRFGLGGCLADDMGLGKTIQFTAYLQHNIEQGHGQGPSLLICPTSVIGNWEKELERFAPNLRVLVHYGPKRDRGEGFAAAAAEADLVITSYALTPIDEEELCQVQWDVVCLDEAQNIKNYYTKQSGVIRKLPSNHRVALTGTPMENRLTELWSIYDFTNPGYLGSLNEFRKAVVAPIERERNAELINELQRWVKPFMLRRVKKDPAIQLALPDKNETRTYLSLTVEQGTLYENIVSELLGKLESLGAMQRRGLILSTLTRLKQVCDHPNLLLKEGVKDAWDPERSNKVLRVLEMVEEIAAEGERCLIFTQYVDMGETLKRLLEERLELPVPYLYGGVPKAARDKMIQTFQDEGQPGCAFVLSLKAGGTGLNLTAANHVIHFDRWWNPAVENQATDRAFRIGQTRNVQVHKYVTLGTLEERIDDMITRKQTLNDQVVGQSENWITELSTDELRELFSLRKHRLKG
ncbi:RNA polymerase-associated protein RapA [Paenibacillus plantiphilus]|uniref:RNA polymerase-associated protein RapA n=1 Tax=Paenibacillus plantiphilus TaxID=2905650 RepID=A0ABN8GDL9_9BACL|nr:DEAD/DEAH box helicase [Paenibacillus plantiphilus]CAH1206271.1 RNA polymerase-associated protein RapA [Paenibacillus plantiphilus]